MGLFEAFNRSDGGAGGFPSLTGLKLILSLEQWRGTLDELLQVGVGCFGHSCICVQLTRVSQI